MLVLRRLALPLFLVALLATGAFAASSANQTRGKTNRAAILKNRAARGEKGRVRTQFVRDTGKSSLVKVMKLDASGKRTGVVEAYLVNKETGTARRTSAATLKSKKAKPVKKAAKKPVVSKKPKGTKVASRTKKPAAATASDAVEPAAAEVAAATTPAPETTAPETTAPETKAPAKGKATATPTGPVVTPMMTAARSAVMKDPMVAKSESVANIDPEAITPAEAMAMAVVEQRLKVTVRSDYDVAPTFEQSRGDKSNPVTGTGMIELVAVQKVKGKQGFFKRLLHSFNPRAQRRVELMLDAEGKPAYMVDRADSLPYRLVRTVLERVPLRDFVNDVVRSDGVRKGGIMAVLGGSVAVMTGPVGWGIAGVVAPMAWKSSIDGLKQRKLARQTALTEAVTEIKQSLGDGKTVTIEEAYETYKAKLSGIKEGTAVDAPSTPASPISRRDFVKAISAPPHNL